MHKRPGQRKAPQETAEVLQTLFGAFLFPAAAGSSCGAAFPGVNMPSFFSTMRRAHQQRQFQGMHMPSFF
jgi:hypothetical protein